MESEEVELSTSQVVGTDDVFMEEDEDYDDRFGQLTGKKMSNPPYPDLKIKKIKMSL